MSEGSFLDMADNQFAGIGRTDTYNFTTKGVSGIGSEAVGIVTTLIPYSTWDWIYVRRQWTSWCMYIRF